LPNGISKRIENILYVSKLVKNLLPINQLMRQGFKVEFEATKCWLKFSYSNKVIVEVIKEGRLYKLIGVVQSLVLDGSTKTKRNDLCHQKFEHVSM
jgi:hypothetical protein